MSSKLKIKQLEKKYKQVTRNRDKVFVVRDITEDGRLLDKDAYIMTEEEVRQISKQDAEIHKQGGTVVLLTSYRDLKLKSNSATKPYYVNPYKGENPRA